MRRTTIQEARVGVVESDRKPSLYSKIKQIYPIDRLSIEDQPFREGPLSGFRMADLLFEWIDIHNMLWVLSSLWTLKPLCE